MWKNDGQRNESDREMEEYTSKMLGKSDAMEKKWQIKKRDGFNGKWFNVERLLWKYQVRLLVGTLKRNFSVEKFSFEIPKNLRIVESVVFSLKHFEAIFYDYYYVWLIYSHFFYVEINDSREYYLF